MPESTVIIAGGTGFIGTALVEKLFAAGYKLVVLSRHPGQVQRLFQNRVQAVA